MVIFFGLLILSGSIIYSAIRISKCIERKNFSSLDNSILPPIPEMHKGYEEDHHGTVVATKPMMINPESFGDSDVDSHINLSEKSTEADEGVIDAAGKLSEIFNKAKEQE